MTQEEAKRVLVNTKSTLGSQFESVTNEATTESYRPNLYDVMNTLAENKASFCGIMRE